MKISVRKYGIVHYIAQCKNCDWNAVIMTKETFSTQDVRNAIKKHIRKTRHSVHLESGSSIEYFIS